MPEIGNKQKNKGKGKKNKKPTTLAAEVRNRMVNAKELFEGIPNPSNCQANIMTSTAKAYLTLDKDDIMDILKHATCSAMDEDVDANDIVDDVYAQIPAKYKNSAAGGRRRETFARRAAEFQRSRIASILQSMR